MSNYLATTNANISLVLGREYWRFQQVDDEPYYPRGDSEQGKEAEHAATFLENSNDTEDEGQNK